MKMLNLLCKAVIVCCCAMLTFTGCENGDEPIIPILTPPADPCADPNSPLGIVECAKCDSLNTYIWNMNRFAQPESKPYTASNAKEVKNGDYVCNSKDVTWAPEYNELFMLNPTTEVIYPGSLLDGTSVATGAYRPIVVDRDSLTLSVSLATQQGTPQSVQVAKPSLSSVRNGINEMLSRTISGSTPAYINFEVQKVYAKEEAELHVAANFKGWGAKVSASYDFSRTDIKSRFLIKFFQVYYSVDVDAPKYPCEFFAPIPPVGRAKELLGGTMPVYVSSVKYGRMVYFTVESSHEEEKVEKALHASFKKYGAKVGVDISKEQTNIINTSKITGLIIGGPTESAVNTVSGIENLALYLQEGADYSANSPGVALSYTLRFLSDNSVANIVLSSQYTIRQCEERGEDRVLTPTTVARLYDGCPILTHGDNEFGSDAVKITGKITLYIRGDKKAVMAKIYFHFNESIPDEHPGDTRAEVIDDIVAYEIKDNNKYIANILTEPISEIDYTPNRNGNHYLPFSGDFIAYIIAQANGEDKNDLPCSGYTEDPDGRAFLRMAFKNIKVNLLTQQ